VVDRFRTHQEDLSMFDEGHDRCSVGLWRLWTARSWGSTGMGRRGRRRLLSISCKDGAVEGLGRIEIGKVLGYEYACIRDTQITNNKFLEGKIRLSRSTSSARFFYLHCRLERQK
jgi:hypothetical protein